MWGPRLAPRQTWDLVDTTLRWSTGRWLVASVRVDSTPAPIPSIVYVEEHNDTVAAFARLRGMTGSLDGAPE